MKHEKFSVLLPIYNRKELEYTFPKCLSAIFNNSIRPDELVIICDGPLDWDIGSQLKEYMHITPIKIKKLTANVGLASALNIGLCECSFDVVARVDADDFCSNHRFERQLEFFARGFNLVGSNIQEVDERGSELKRRFVPESAEEIKKFAMRRNPFNHMSVMFNKQQVMAVGGYPNFHLKEDYALWVLLLSQRNVKPYNIQECLMSATAGGSMYSRRSSFKIFKQELKMQFFLRKYLGKDLKLVFLDLLLRGAFHLVPGRLKEAFYNHILRT